MRNLADISRLSEFLRSSKSTLDELLVLDSIVPVRRPEVAPLAPLAGSGLTSAHPIVPCECSHAARPRQASRG